MDSFVIKGNICYSEDKTILVCMPNSYAVCENGVCRGVFSKLPEEYRHLPLTDYGDRLIIPGMTDLHIHAAQYAFRGIHVDEQLLDWLIKHAFPEETRFADPEYAEKA